MAKIIGTTLSNIPWQDKPENCIDVVWRDTKNPIIPRDLIPSSNSIFNSAVVPFKDGFAGVFRCDDKCRRMNIHRGFSKDGINWDIDNDVIKFVCDDPEIYNSDYKYDPRICFIDDRYYVSWCNGYHGATIGMAYTFDFETFYQTENAFLPYNRNGVLFPRKINGNFAMLSRPSDRGQTPFGDIFYSESPDMTYWGKHRFVMSTVRGWQSIKVGAGPIPIETDQGWLVFYHGVIGTCSGFAYSFGATLLDINEPWKILYRTHPYLLSAQENYECVGDVPNVVFPCAALTDADTGRIAIYYGCADTTVGIAYTEVNQVIEFIKNNSL